MEAATILAITELIVKHGVPAALQVIRVWSEEHPEPTLDDIRALRDLVPDPETYFIEGQIET